MKWTRDFLSRKNQKGIALMLALFCTMMIIWLATEVMYESNVEFMINANSISRLKAYYAARSGIELSLLRIKIYSQMQQQFGQNKNIPAAAKQMIDLIWQFPFSWPPMIPDGMNDMAKEALQEKVKESKMEASFTTQISDEGSKIDLGDLDSPSKVLREATKKRLLGIFESRSISDKDWIANHPNFRPEELVNNIVDWVDKDVEGLNGGDELRLYEQPEGGKMPPNRNFRTLEELRLVSGMTDEYYEILNKSLTLFGMRAINPNVATKEILMSLDPTITEQVTKEIFERRDNPAKGGPFQDAADFWNFINASGGRVSEETQKAIPVSTEGIFNFRVKAVGMMGNVSREIEIIVFDFQKTASQVSNLVKTENPDPEKPEDKGKTPPPDANKNNTQNNQTASKAQPRIVYWMEK